MEAYKAILQAGSAPGAEPVISVHGLSLQFQPAMTVNGPQNALDEGNFFITGKQTVRLESGQPLTLDMPVVNFRVGQRESEIAAMPDGPEKTKAAAELTIWQTCLSEIQAATGKALKARHELLNPVEEEA